MTGQEDIEALAELLEEHEKRLPATAPKLVVTPIYAALSPDAQLRAFAPPPHGCRKVVIATNIAESSVTIPGVRYVVDAGLAKMRVFNPRTGAEALLPVPISKAQAWQRAGRAGREAPGKCFRLFTESAFERFRPSPVPEVQRVSLASVVLQLKVLGVGDVFAFDFLQPPSRDALKQAHVQLLRLGALESRGMTVTSLGRRMAALPLPPTLARLILFAPRHGCVDEAVALAAIFSVDSLFIHPRQHREEAGRAHAKFAAPEGDHLAMLAAFNAYLCVPAHNTHTGRGNEGANVERVARRDAPAPPPLPSALGFLAAVRRTETRSGAGSAFLIRATCTRPAAFATSSSTCASASAWRGRCVGVAFASHPLEPHRGARGKRTECSSGHGPAASLPRAGLFPEPGPALPASCPRGARQVPNPAAPAGGGATPVLCALHAAPRPGVCGVFRAGRNIAHLPPHRHRRRRGVAAR